MNALHHPGIGIPRAVPPQQLDLHVIERLRREGDTLNYEVTVEDPVVLVEPWVLTPRRLRLNTNPEAYLPEGLPCKDYDHDNMVTQIRH